MTSEFRQSQLDRRESERREDESSGWHLDKKVPLGLFFAMLVQVVAVVWFFAGIRQDVELLKADAVALHSIDTAQANSLKEAMTLMRDQLKDLNLKMDRLIERDHTK